MFEDIETVLDASVRSDEMRVEIRKIVETHDLDQDLAKEIDDYEAFTTSLTQLMYHELREVQETESINWSWFVT